MFCFTRVSTGGQQLHSQIDALKKAGVPEKFIFIDKASGAKSERLVLDNWTQGLKSLFTFFLQAPVLRCLATEHSWTEWIA